jgi:hypothetical protein
MSAVRLSGKRRKKRFEMSSTKQTIRSSREQFDRANLESAVLIMANPIAFPEGSLATQWARLFLQRQQRATQDRAA